MTSLEPGERSTFREVVEINRLISSLDPGKVLDAVALQAARLVGGDAAALLMQDDGGLRVAATYALDVRDAYPLARGTEVMQAIRELGTAAGLPECVGVPLVLRNATIGVLAVYRRSPRAWSAGDEELLSALADQAAIALENARIHRQLELHAAALQESEERFRTALDEAPIGIALVAADGRFLRVNAALAELLGYEREELTGLTLRDVTFPDDVPTDVALLEQLARGDIARYELEKRYVRKDGEIVETVMSRSVVRTKSGAPLYFISHIADVTAARRAERERAQLFQRLQAVLDEAPVGILLTHDGLTWQANAHAHKLFGRPIDGSGCVDAWFGADEKPLAPEHFPGTRALRGEKLSAVELRVRQPDGTMLPILVDAAPISHEGHSAGAVVAFENISSLIELERLRIEWRALIAHDLRHPLQTIAMAGQLAAVHAGGNPPVQHRLAQIKESVRRLDRMVEDLLDFSKLEARQLSLDRHVLDAASLVSKIAERVGLEAPGRQIDVQATGGSTEVYVDPDRFAQILENLLTNAIKYGTDGTPITIGVTRAGDTVTVAVTNVGPGIRADEIPGLFHRFRRVEMRGARRVPGTGVGLYITRELVEAHGGTVTVDSTCGATTTFRFTLPAASGAATAATARP